MIILRNLGLYLITFLPLTWALGLVEGALRGMWGLTGIEASYQTGAWVAFEVPGLLIIALPTVLLVHAGLRLVGERRSARVRRGLAVVLAPLAVTLAGLALGSLRGMLLLSFPASWVLSAVVFGFAFRLPPEASALASRAHAGVA